MCRLPAIAAIAHVAESAAINRQNRKLRTENGQKYPQ